SVIPPLAIEAAKRGKAAADALSEKICTLSVGLIGLSMAFLPEEIRNSAKDEIWILHTSWISLGLSVVFSILYSYAPIDMAESAIAHIKRNPEDTHVQTVAWRGFIW